MSVSEEKENLKRPFIYLSVLISVYFLFSFASDNPTAFEWPAVDMVPFFERVEDPTYLPDDFYTNTTETINPRHLFGYTVIGFSHLLGITWYQAFFLLKVIFITFIPALLFLFLFGIIRNNITTHLQSITVQFFLLVGILFLASDNSALFSIAWWPPLKIIAASQTFSIFLFLVGIVCYLYGSLYSKNLGYLFFFLASLVHITIGVSLIVFYSISTVNRFHRRSFLLSIFSGMILPAIVLVVFFSDKSDLSTTDFINIYVFERHSNHYSFYDFGSLTQYPWWVSYILIVALLSVPVVYSLVKKNKPFLTLSIMLLLSYSLVPFIQYLIVFVVPVKSLVAFGPIRYSFLGYWMILLLYGLMVVTSITRNKNIVLPEFLYGKYLVAFALSILLVCYVTIAKIDKPKELFKRQNPDFYSWIEGTKPESVFAAFNSDYVYKIPFVAKRAIFVGSGFPFSEIYFREFQERNALVNGSHEKLVSVEGNDLGEKYLKFYHSLSASDFVGISQKYPLDYVVMKAEYPHNLKSEKPVFYNQEIEVYKVSDFKK